MERERGLNFRRIFEAWTRRRVGGTRAEHCRGFGTTLPTMAANS